MAKLGGSGLWETRLKEKHPMLRYFSDRPFGVEIEIFGLKYSITTGDRQVIPPYQIMNRTRDGRRLPQVFQDQDLVLNGFSLMNRLTRRGLASWMTPLRGPAAANW